MGVSLLHRDTRQERACFPDMDPRLLAIYRRRKGPAEGNGAPPPRIALREPKRTEAVPSDPSRVFAPETTAEKDALRENMVGALAKTPLERDLVADFLLAKSFLLAGELLCSPKEDRTFDSLLGLFGSCFDLKETTAAEPVTGCRKDDNYIQLVTHIHLDRPVSLDMLAIHFEITQKDMLERILKSVASAATDIVNSLNAPLKARYPWEKLRGKNDPKEAFRRAIARVRSFFYAP